MKEFKDYAKAAKQRMVSGFWQDVKTKLATERQSAEGGQQVTLAEHKERVKNIIYNHNFDKEEEFYQQVVSLIESDEVIANPLGVLADKSLLETMTVSQRQNYLSELSRRYVCACNRYKKEKFKL